MNTDAWSPPPLLADEPHEASARRFSDRVAVVTGATGGIGGAIARALGEHGLAVGLLGRDTDRLAQTEVQVLAAGARDTATLRQDFTKAAPTEDLIANLDHRLGGIDILIHSATMYTRAPMETAAIEDFDALYAVNLRGPYRLLQQFLPMLRRRKGDILLINSTQGIAASGGVSQYAATQHALKAIADSLREEVNSAGVRVTLVHVGSTATPLQARICASAGRPYVPERLLQPKDIASLVIATLLLPHTAEVTSIMMRPLQKP